MTTVIVPCHLESHKQSSWHVWRCFGSVFFPTFMHTVTLNDRKNKNKEHAAYFGFNMYNRQRVTLYVSFDSNKSKQRFQTFHNSLYTWSLFTFWETTVTVQVSVMNGFNAIQRKKHQTVEFISSSRSLLNFPIRFSWARLDKCTNF